MVGKCSEWVAEPVRSKSGLRNKDCFPGAELRMCLEQGHHEDGVTF